MEKIGLISGTVPFEVKFSETNEVSTEYGKPSSPLHFFQIEGTQIIHITRHGPNHEIPPHKIPHKANLSALKQEGVSRIIGISSTGIINTNIKPGSLVVPNDLINLNHPTFFDKETIHVSLAEPFCPQLRKTIIEKLKQLDFPYAEGIIVSPRGPSFETSAEIQFFSKSGADIVNMTTTKEAILARELGMCYASICTADNFATGIGENYEYSDIKKEAEKTAENVKRLLEAILPLPEQNCSCSEAPEKGKV